MSSHNRFLSFIFATLLRQEVLYTLATCLFVCSTKLALDITAGQSTRTLNMEKTQKIEMLKEMQTGLDYNVTELQKDLLEAKTRLDVISKILGELQELEV